MSRVTDVFGTMMLPTLIHTILCKKDGLSPDEVLLRPVLFPKRTLVTNFRAFSDPLSGTLAWLLEAQHLDGSWSTGVSSREPLISYPTGNMDLCEPCQPAGWYTTRDGHLAYVTYYRGQANIHYVVNRLPTKEEKLVLEQIEREEIAAGRASHV